MPPLPKMSEELRPCCLGLFVLSAGLFDIGMTFLRLSLSRTTKICRNIRFRLFDVQGDICSVPWCLWIVKRKYTAARAGTGPKATILRHILSAAIWHRSSHCAGVAAGNKASFEATTPTKETNAAARLPNPCLRHQVSKVLLHYSKTSHIANTAFINAPRHLTVANSDVITDERGQSPPTPIPMTTLQNINGFRKERAGPWPVIGCQHPFLLGGKHCLARLPHSLSSVRS